MSEKLKQIQRDFRVLIIRDKKRSRLRLYGQDKDRQRAQQVLSGTMKADSSTLHFIELGQDTFRKALNGGFQQILSILGHDVATIDIASTPKRIIVTGSSEDYQTAVSILSGQTPNIKVDTKTENDCPICWCEAENPIRTWCNHVYCHECFENQCSAAAAGDGDSSIRCHGDSETCKAVFGLAELQEHLSSTAFEDTLQSSFASYIRQRPHIFRYCPTPDCDQIYRAESTAKTYTCPKCVSVICASCHVSHENQTCAEYKDFASGRLEALEKFKKESGCKDCPRCKTTMIKSEGCNHMTCGGCGIHICWVCLETFGESGLCYDHMTRMEHKIRI
jgi:hypothetical protein